MEKSETKKLVRDMGYLASVYNKTLIQNIVTTLHPADLAEILQQLSEQNRERIFHLLELETASEVLAELDRAAREPILKEMNAEQIYELTEEMESDDLTDILSTLPKELAEEVLSKMDEKESADVQELLTHSEKTAGGLMGKEFVAVEEKYTIMQAIAEIRRRTEEVENVYYVFVVDHGGRLVGVLSLKRLILSPSDTRVAEIMNKDVISVNTSKDQEEVAYIARKYDLVSIPVVDDERLLVGRITFDDVMDVIEEEAAEDISKMAGISDEILIGETSYIKISRIRLPWLLIGLLGGILAALLISLYEQAIKKEVIIILGFFTPVIMSMGGNIGIQSSTIVVRGLATGEIGFAYKHLFKEIKIALLNGLICSIIFFVAAYFWKDLTLGYLLGLSLFLVMVIAATIGAVVPLILNKLNVDPAIATGPFITISNDLIGLAIYFTMATLMIDV